MPSTDNHEPVPSRTLGAGSAATRLRADLTAQVIVPNLQPELVDGVFEGGGALGTAYIGALQALAQNNVWFARVAGTSAGAIIAALIAAGYTASELHWLCAPPGTLPAPTSLPASIKKPINFMDFLDLPTHPQQIGQETREATFLWQALSGVAFNQFMEQSVTILKTPQKLVDDFIQTNLAAAPVRGMLESLLRTVFGGARKLSALLGEQANTARVTLANRTWQSYAAEHQPYLWLVNLLYEGGLCEGTEFRQTIERLLRAKGLPRTGPGSTVAFRDLPLDLVLISADTSVGELQTYSKKATPAMSVAEAVRRSMSIPFLFQPCLADQPRLRDGSMPEPAHEMMDGGLCSNYPYWVFSSAGAHVTSDSSADAQRLKLGFLLDSRKSAPAEWGVAPPKWLSEGRPSDPGALTALRATLAVKLAGDWLDISRQLKEAPSPPLQLLDRALRVYATRDYKEEFLRERIAAALMAGRPYYEINIPLEGYHWLDFSVNSIGQLPHFNAMIDRGRHTARATLEQAGLLGRQPTAQRQAL